MITASVVSHEQGPLVEHLLQDAQGLETPVRWLVTTNLPEPDLRFPPELSVTQHTNPRPLGFGGNHNQAFSQCDTDYFCVVNPDIRMPQDPFPALLQCMEDPSVGVVAPMVQSPQGATEDSARRFPTLGGLGAKALGLSDGRYAISPNAPPTDVDWTAGMFLLFRTEAFREVGGFDDKFHLYYEDVDICARLWKAGWKVVLQPQTAVIHDAQRTSRRNARFMAWHLGSMARYLAKHTGRLPRTPV